MHPRETRTMGPKATTRIDSTRQLIELFCANAEGFSRTLGSAEAGYRECVFHGLAISIELSLKAYLMHVDMSDDWNRFNIRHDLRKALRLAQGAGLGAISPDVLSLISSLSEPYRKHAMHRFAMEEGTVPTLVEARRAVRTLLSIVRATINVATSSEHDSYAAEASR